MSNTFVARIRKDGKITVPKDVRDLLKVQADDLYEITMRKPDWWDLLDWNEMGQEAFDRLPDEIKQKIRASGGTEA